MAFHQPTRQATQRVFRPTVEEEESPREAQLTTTPGVEESQTWVLFSPPTKAGTTASYLTATHDTKTTPGRSRLSDLGSLNTVARSDNSAVHHPTASYEDVIDEDEDAELDSLDSHLPEFRSAPNPIPSSQGIAHATTVVPAHDGLGSFRLNHEGMGQEVQDRLYAFEQYNPRRVRRRCESLEFAQAELENEPNQEMDKMRRIETWRLEQSRYVLEEIQKETRRRRHSVASVSGTRPGDKKVEDIAAISLGVTRDVIADTGDQSEAWHDQQASDFGSDRESVWGRITRKVIRDLMGIDDKLLSVLFGESSPDEDDLFTTPKASTNKDGSSDVAMENSTDSSWQLRILERIAKELGLFVHQISEHPGAFSTFTRVQQMPIPYAGLPSIPESTNDAAQVLVTRDVNSAIPEFQPTIPSRPVDVPNARPVSSPAQGASHVQNDHHASGATFTQEEWEQDLDVRLVFRYLRSRFMSRSASSGSISGNAHLATSSTQEVAAKAARVRQHHPLVSRARPTERRSFKAALPSSPVLLRHASSCASQSTRKSVRRSSCSSRHYWDIGAGSVGTGSLIAATGPMGSWGEV